ncbi:MAG: VOC family protein [Pseudomonadota bacterium]|nr:VOC family protein [Pseudomonadota bacterium]
MNLNTYLSFDGTCAEAMRFYEKTLEGGKLEGMMKWSEMPGAGAEAQNAGDRIMHASLSLPGGRSLMASDCRPGQPYQKMQGITLSLGFASLDEAKKIFDALAVGGQVTMPLQKTFWSEGFGMLTDRFGTPWMANVEHG